MKTVVAIVVMLMASACSGPEVPKAFQADSPASPDAPPAARMSVASVLAAPNPIDARVCAPDQACALVDAPGTAPASDGHQHGGHDHGNHGGHGGMNHDHSTHSPKAQPPAPPAAPPAGHQHHSGHNH
jgi:hypothetical protein